MIQEKTKQKLSTSFLLGRVYFRSLEEIRGSEFLLKLSSQLSLDLEIFGGETSQVFSHLIPFHTVWGTIFPQAFCTQLYSADMTHSEERGNKSNSLLVDF